MLRWIAALFGFEYPTSQDSTTVPKDPCEISVEKLKWPQGPQIRKEVRRSEPAGWDDTNWAWRSMGLVKHVGSLHPQVDHAECRFCLGVLECQGCGMLVRPKTKSGKMNAQLMQGCPDATCRDVLERIHCEARMYRSVEVEDGIEYSKWEHTGYHHTHPRPPMGRQPSRVHNVPGPSNAKPSRSGNTTRVGAARSSVVAGPKKTTAVRKAAAMPAGSPKAPFANKPDPPAGASVTVTTKMLPYDASPFTTKPVVWQNEK